MDLKKILDDYGIELESEPFDEEEAEEVIVYDQDE